MEGTCDSCGDQSTELKPAETQPGNLCPACYEWEIVNGNGNQTSSVPDDRLPWTDRTELIAQTINLPEWENYWYGAVGLMDEIYEMDNSEILILQREIHQLSEFDDEGNLR